MILVLVEAEVSPGSVDAAKATFEQRADVVRAMPDCARYALYAAEKSLCIVQRWHSMTAFEAYRGSDPFKQLVLELKPLFSAPPVTSVATVTMP